MQLKQLLHTIETALDDLKAIELKTIDVRDMTSVMDFMVLVTGTSNRHVKALADNLVEKMREVKCKPLGIEGERESEWVLVDFGDVVVHIMLPQIRAMYNLEKLWDKDLLLEHHKTLPDASH